MYNRYIPQPDGSFRRNRMPDNPVHTPQQHTPRPKPANPECKEPVSLPRPEPKQEHPRERQTPSSTVSGVGSFLKQLLPRNFDTSDLIIVLLLLLMAGDSPEDQSTALLTLAIYLYL